MAKGPTQTTGTTRSFTGANPSHFAKVQGDSAAIGQLKAINFRGERVKDRARQHFSKYEETWVVKEGIALWKQRAGLYEPAVGLPRIAKEYAAQSVMTEARRNVRARMTQRLTKINGIKTRMSNAVVRNLQSLSPEPGHSPSQGSPKKGSPSR